MLSPCCQARVFVTWGQHLCSICWGPVPLTDPKQITQQKPALDIIDWVFPPEPEPRPKGTFVFVRQGKRSIRWTDSPRGKVKSWSW
jgi:hypothetical protein